MSQFKPGGAYSPDGASTSWMSQYMQDGASRSHMQPVLARWSQYRFDEPVQARWSQYKPGGANIYKRKPVQVEPVYASLSQCTPG